MSGIFGIVNLDGRPVLRENLVRMKNALNHRGPDGSGIWLEGGAGMGHLAMHITPESVHEKLPDVSSGSGLVITADARIDNRSELFDLLGIDRREHKDMPDSRLILKAYEKWGETCPRYLVGEFAFAMWDSKNRVLFCARDHMGFVPFFYRSAPDCFIFASETKAIRALPFVPSKLEEAMLARALIRLPFQQDGGHTFFKGIMRLQMGNRLVIKAIGGKAKPHILSYWNPLEKKQIRYASTSQYGEALRELIVEATHCRLRKLPHLQAGITLSGGLDSSALACIAAVKQRSVGENLVAVSSVLRTDHRGIETDERPYIQVVLNQEPNILIHYVTADGAGPFDNLDLFFQEAEMPVNYYHYMDHALRKTARNHGVRLLLSGLGGDHMASYAGNDSLVRLILDRQWVKAARLARQFSHAENTPLYKTLIKNLLKSLGFHHVVRRKTNSIALSPINPDFIKKNGMTPESIDYDNQRTGLDYGSMLLDKIKYGEFAMAHENIRHAHLGMICLFPFFDKRILEFFLAVPPEHFLAGGWRRGLFRCAMEGILPHQIRWRRDKHPYSPDFHRRVLHAKQEIRTFLTSIHPDDPVHHYIDVNKIHEQLNHIKPVGGMDQWEGKTMSVVVKGVILIRYLRWLQYHS